MRGYIFFLALILFPGCTRLDGKVKEVYNDGKALKVQMFIPSNWSEYKSYEGFRDKVHEYSSALGVKDTSSFVMIQILNYEDFSAGYREIDSVLAEKMSIVTGGDTTIKIIERKIFTNDNGKKMGTCYYFSSGLEHKRYYKMIVFVKDKKVGVLTVIHKYEGALLQVADYIENTLDF